MMRGVADAQTTRAQAIIAYLQSQPQLFLPLLSPANGERVFFAESTSSPVVDADLGEWPPISAEQTTGTARASFARVRDTLYAALRTSLRDSSAENPTLGIYTREQRLQLLLLPGGSVVAANDSEDMRLQDSLLGRWSSSNDEIRIEIAFPASLTGSVFGLEILQGEERITWGLSETNRPLSWVTEQPELRQVLDIFRVPGSRAEILTTDGWVVAATGEVSQRTRQPNFWDSATTQLLARSINSDTLVPSQDVQRFWSLAGAAPSLTTDMSIRVGGLKVATLRTESSLVQFLATYSLAIERFLLINLGLIVVIAVGLFIYAGWLSRRVRSLSNWAHQVIDEGGQTRNQLPASGAKDEIGELSRAYASLMQRLEKHTEYLQGLAGRLSHEIRTPLTIIGSSLENLESASTEAERQTYTERARNGLERLRSLLRRMSEVTSLEGGIDNTPRQNFDPDNLISELVSGYAQSFLDHRLDYQRATGGPRPRIDGSPELLAQLFDKLIENAVSFAPVQTTIHITTGQQKAEWFLEVSNSGPLLPEDQASDIFSSMVSLRARDANGEPHLGLGLTIVKRIAEFHRGKIWASNREDGSGVVFRLSLPTSSRTASI